MRAFEYLKQYIDVLVNGRLMDDVHDDIRTETEKSQDYIYGKDVLLPRAAISKRIKKLPFKAYDQQSTSACGAYSAAHARRLESGSETFPLTWYRARTNYPGTGMYIKDVLELIAYAVTTIAPSNVPSELTEKYANELEKIDVIVKDKTREYFQIKPYDADGIFESVSAGHPTLITFFSTYNEWQEELIPKDTVWLSTAKVRHYVVALPNSVHSRDGYEWVSVIDSSPAHGYSLRHMRRDFIEQRMYLGGGFVSTKKITVTKTDWLPLDRCQYNDQNLYVLDLQRYLVSQGLMEEKHCTSYYGNITAKAVLQWQLENSIYDNISEITDLKGYYWGPASIKKVISKHTNV